MLTMQSHFNVKTNLTKYALWNSTFKVQKQKQASFGNAALKQRRNVQVVSSVGDQFVYGLAQAVETTGEVEAPIWIVVASAVVVTLGSLLAVFLLKPGIDAAEKMQERDSRKWNK